MPSFGPKSRAVRDTLHPVLQSLCDRVVAVHDITLLTGHRDREAQDRAYEMGRSSKQYPESKHNTLPSMAVDAAPWPIPDGWGDLSATIWTERDLEWKERVKFYQMAAVFQATWETMKKDDPRFSMYRLRWGGDWDSDNDFTDNTFDDLVHLELVPIRS